MARVEKTVTIGAISIFPSTPEKNVCDKKTHDRRSSFFRLKGIGQGRHDISRAQESEGLETDAVMVQPVVKSGYVLRPHVKLKRIKRPCRGHTAIVEVRA